MKIKFPIGVFPFPTGIYMCRVAIVPPYGNRIPASGNDNRTPGNNSWIA
ncbi:hypothetical protein [Bacteroides intestinalis]|nr:hypothetical protein [Bacteroides intestinalis]